MVHSLWADHEHAVWWHLAQVATPVWAEATVVEEVLRTIAVRAQLRIIAAQVRPRKQAASRTLGMPNELADSPLLALTH